MSLVDTVKLHWRHYLPIWLFFPAFFIAGSYFNFPIVVFSLVAFPLFFVASIWAMLPYLRRKVGYWPNLFWSVLVPVGCWFLAVAFVPSTSAA